MMQQSIRPLIFIPSPRELYEFKIATAALHFDKLWIKNFEQQEAYKTGRQYFLEHEEYTHLIILPDDLIVKAIDIERLLKTAKYGLVVSGWCTHGKSPEKRVGLDSNISFTFPKVPAIRAGYDDYKFIPIVDIDDFVSSNKNLAPIGFTGFAPTVIPRAVVKRVPFRTSDGCCVDTCFSQDLYEKGITQHADLRVKTVELVATDANLLNVGKKEKEVVFESV